MKVFKDRVAVITGAGGGVGRSLAQVLASRGCHLALVDISENALKQTLESLYHYAVDVSLHTVDVSDKQQMAALPKAVLARHGAVNILVNNAGITYQKSFSTHTMDDWERIVGINWWGVLYGCHYFLPALSASGEGHVINMSSMNGYVGLPGQTSYCATKAAVRLLSEAMWAELDKLNIGVTTVHPGAIKTDMIQATLKNSDDLQVAQRHYELAQKLGVSADFVARRIVTAIEKKAIRIRIGKDAVILDYLKRLFPVLLQKMLRKIA